MNRIVAGIKVRPTRITTSFVLNLYPRILLLLSRYSLTRLLATKNMRVRRAMIVRFNRIRTVNFARKDALSSFM